MDWSNLQEEYDRLGSVRAVAELHGVSRKVVETRMRRMGITAKPMRGRTVAWDDERRAAHKVACNTPEFKDKHRASLLKRLKLLRGASADSPLEFLLHRALLRAGVSFTTQAIKLDRYVVDIELTQAPVIIEADGLLHRLERQRAKDQLRDNALREAGYEVFRFTGTEINAGPDACIEKVIAATGIVPEASPAATIRRGVSGADSSFWRGGKATFKCDHCGAEFQEYPANRTHPKVFCSRKCHGLWAREHPESNPVSVRWANHPKPTVVCARCGKEFRVEPNVLARARVQHCSWACRTNQMVT